MKRQVYARGSFNWRIMHEGEWFNPVGSFLDDVSLRHFARKVSLYKKKQSSVYLSKLINSIRYQCEYFGRTIAKKLHSKLLVQ